MVWHCRIFTLLPIICYLFASHYSIFILLPISCFPLHHIYFLPIICCLFASHCSIFTLLPSHYLLPIAWYLLYFPLFAIYLPPTAPYLLPIICYIFASHCSIFTLLPIICYIFASYCSIFISHYLLFNCLQLQHTITPSLHKPPNAAQLPYST